MDAMHSVQAAQTFGNALAQSLSACFTQRLGSPWQFRLIEEQELAPRFEQTAGFGITAEGGLHGECRVALEQREAVALAAKLLGEPARTFKTKHIDAVIQLLSLGMAELSATLLGPYGPVTFVVNQDATPMDEAGEEKPAVALAGAGEDGAQLSVLLSFNEEMLGAMGNVSPAKGAGGAKTTAVDATNLQLVMDVELNVSLRFGQCQLPLREVLDLSNGSVIELDRDVDDPVELLLDGKVIARGEAVIVDGNYGLRVTEIPEPMASHFGG